MTPCHKVPSCTSSTAMLSPLAAPGGFICLWPYLRRHWCHAEGACRSWHWLGFGTGPCLFHITSVSLSLSLSLEAILQKCVCGFGWMHRRTHLPENIGKTHTCSFSSPVTRGKIIMRIAWVFLVLGNCTSWSHLKLLRNSKGELKTGTVQKRSGEKHWGLFMGSERLLAFAAALFLLLFTIISSVKSDLQHLHRFYSLAPVYGLYHKYPAAFDVDT